MSRNLDRRVELLFSVEDEDLKKKVAEILRLFFQDNMKAHLLRQDGSYYRLTPNGEPPVRAQKILHDEEAERAGEDSPIKDNEFIVRRKPPVLKKGNEARA